MTQPIRFVLYSLGLAAVVIALLWIGHARAGECPAAPLGVPMIAGTELVCHAGYASLLDPKLQETRLVTYQLTAAHSVAGCIPRTGLTFKVDKLAPSSAQGRLVDYAGSGYDLGHLADAADFSFDVADETATFSFANVVPQLPGLNRQMWERLEDTVRAWAFSRSVVDIFTGPIFGPNSATIGKDKLPIPISFYKVIFDPAANAVIAFEMPQKAIPKGDLQPWLVPLSKVLSDSGIALSVPASAKVSTTVWATDLPAYAREKQAACAPH